MTAATAFLSSKAALLLLGITTFCSLHGSIHAASTQQECSSADHENGVCSSAYGAKQQESKNGRDLETAAGRKKCLYQGDFDQGTKVITEPGKYKLCEDIVFYPLVNPPTTSREGAADGFEPIFTDLYDENAYGLGYFAALSIAAPDVTLDLNGYTIRQSQEHALLQRFFAVIELANSPFIKNAGPAQFVGESTDFAAASNVKIVGPGTIGLSSHHGIHGNNNDNVEIRNVTFVDFEVAAVSLNKVNGLVIEDCDIVRNKQDVPILGLFSAAKFIRPYGKILKKAGFKMNLRGVETSAATVYNKLVTSINNVYRDVIQTGFIRKDLHPEEYELFHNDRKVVDGPCYAFLVHGNGPAVEDFGFDQLSSNLTSSKIAIRNNNIKNIKCWTNEVPAIVEDGKVVADPRGSVFQLIRSEPNKEPLAINKDGTYKGNIVADMQIMVAKAINDGIIKDSPKLQTPVNSINMNVINWASSATDTYSPKYRCNGDSMHHVSKGITVIRIDDAMGFDVENNLIKNIENLSPAPFDDCVDFHGAQNSENSKSNVRQGGIIRGISVAASNGFNNKQNIKSSLSKNKIVDFSSKFADVIVGIDIQGKSELIQVERNRVDLKNGVGEDPEDVYVALRTRSFNKNFIDVNKNNNKFAQESQVFKFTKEEEAALMDLSSGCPVQRMKWKYGLAPGGGCPFSQK